MKRVFQIIIVACMLVASGYASVGTVERHKGTSFVLRNQQKIMIHNGLHLEVKDTIYTSKNAWVKLRLNDNTVINAGKNAKLVIQDYLYTKKSNSKASFSFLKGLFRTITGQIGKVAPDKFKVHTPNATIGIRGTEFYIDLAKAQEKIFCTKGRIIIDSTLGEIEVEAGRVFLMNGTKYMIKKINLNTIQKRIGIRVKQATIKEKALIKRSMAGILTRKDESDAAVEQDSHINIEVDAEVVEQENALFTDNVVPEAPQHEPCPVPK